jgi:hypothetical protein
MPEPVIPVAQGGQGPEFEVAKAALLAVGMPTTIIDNLGKRVKLRPEDPTETEVNADFLAAQLHQASLNRAFQQKAFADNDFYKAELAEMGRKAFADQVKALGESLLPENEQKAKELGTKYKDKGVFTPAALKSLAAELRAEALKPLQEQIALTSSGTEGIKAELDKARQQNQDLAKQYNELELAIKKVKEEEMPAQLANFEAQLAENKQNLILFREFYKLPSVYDEGIIKGDADSETAKENQIARVLVPYFKEAITVEKLSNGVIQYRFNNQSTPIMIGNSPATLQQVILMIAKDAKLGRFYQYTPSASGGAANLPPDPKAAQKMRGLEALGHNLK